MAKKLSVWWAEFSRQNRIFLCLQIAIALWAAFLWIHLPAPGWAVAILAGVAAAMSVHGEMRGWQKAIWMALIGSLLLIELRAISKDRADNSATQASFFAAQQQGFSTTASGLQAAIAALNQTLSQTAPRALFGKPFIDFGNAQIGPGTQFHYNITLVNSGNDSAHNVDIFSREYVAKPDDAPTQRRLTEDFEREWNLHKPLSPADLPPSSPNLVTYYSPRFTSEEVQGMQASSLTLYTFVRTEYSDGTGTWYSDYCDDWQVPIQAGVGILTHPCPLPTSFRYKRQ